MSRFIEAHYCSSCDAVEAPCPCCGGKMREASYFADCPRDEHGWCTSSGGTPTGDDEADFDALYDKLGVSGLWEKGWKYEPASDDHPAFGGWTKTIGGKKHGPFRRRRDDDNEH